MKKRVKKLALAKDTVRELGQQRLSADVAGGMQMVNTLRTCQSCDFTSCEDTHTC